MHTLGGVVVPPIPNKAQAIFYIFIALLKIIVNTPIAITNLKKKVNSKMPLHKLNLSFGEKKRPNKVRPESILKIKRNQNTPLTKNCFLNSSQLLEGVYKVVDSYNTLSLIILFLFGETGGVVVKKRGGI